MQHHPERAGTAGSTMTVTVRDRSVEGRWGSGGLINPAIRSITISAFCPVCGARRGEPRGLNQCDDGAWYWVQVWDNPCGHLDMYPDVVHEASQIADCVHQEDGNLDNDAHRANCLHDPGAAARLAHAESRWDATGTNGHEL